jgi:hypothetical protein
LRVWLLQKENPVSRWTFGAVLTDRSNLKTAGQWALLSLLAGTVATGAKRWRLC